jgi:predicted nucleic-acid-binding Zn-ribbon protein
MKQIGREKLCPKCKKPLTTQDYILEKSILKMLFDRDKVTHIKYVCMNCGRIYLEKLYERFINNQQ